MNPRSVRADMQALIDLAAQEILEELPEALLDYARTGSRPQDDLHASYIDLSLAFDALADASVGTDQPVYDAAVEAYLHVLGLHEEILDSYGLPMPRGRELSRWYKLRPHAVQRALWESSSRFRVAACGRRSGKTELLKRHTVRLAVGPQQYPDCHYVLTAPTWQQGKRVFWSDVKQLVPIWALAGNPRDSISEGELTVAMANGSQISVTGLDRPMRVEGSPIDFVGVDEAADTKDSAWSEHLRAGLSERGGSGWLVSTPNGRGWFWRMSQAAQESTAGTWAFFTWPSADILPPEEIEAARRELDSRTFDQEFCASFNDPTGRAYYSFDRTIHAAEPVPYVAGLPLHLSFDFNVSPGVACICQEVAYEGNNAAVARDSLVTCVIGEVFIGRDSNTPKVCQEILRRYGSHTAGCYVYGDATGGAKGTSQTEGSDWDLVRQHLAPLNPKFRVPHVNPAVRARVNCVNARLQSADGRVHLLVDPSCRHLIEDFEGVTWTAGGDIDKKSSPMLTHCSDGLGYFLHRLHPLVQHQTRIDNH